MVGNPADNMIDTVDAFEPGESLNACEVERGPVVFVFGEHRNPIRDVVPHAGQGVKTRDEVRMGSERTVGNVHPIYEQVVVHPTEGYFAAFGGYTFGGKFDAEATGVFNGVTFGNDSLANSAVVGAKAGGFFPESLNWFGVEAELFNARRIRGRWRGLRIRRRHLRRWRIVLRSKLTKGDTPAD